METLNHYYYILSLHRLQNGSIVFVILFYFINFTKRRKETQKRDRDYKFLLCISWIVFIIHDKTDYDTEFKMKGYALLLSESILVFFFHIFITENGFYGAYSVNNIRQA